MWAREAERVANEGRVPAPWYIKAPFWALCVVLDLFYADRPIQRFWVLETVARIPYFAYISILHLYESLGFWRAGRGGQVHSIALPCFQAVHCHQPPHALCRIVHVREKNAV